MKKVVFIFLLSFVFLISCSNSSESEAKLADDQESEQNTPENPDNEKPDENTQEEQDEPAVVDEEIVPDNEPDNEPEQPDENQNIPDFEAIGTFNLSFTGPVHASVSINDVANLGGEGAAEFVYNGQPITFDKININAVVMNMDLFPMAMLNNGIVVVWLDSFSVSDATGNTAVQKQVFGINLPQNTEIGSGEMAGANIYAFYGDMMVNVRGGQFDIKCVRSVTNVGNYEVTVNDGTNLTMTASGDLLDPAAGAAYLPYPACDE